MVKKLFFFLIPFLFLSQWVIAQDRLPFPKDSLGFFERVEKMMKSEDNRKKEAKEFLEKFEPVWFGGYFDDEIRQKIYETCDKMNEKRMLPFPEFHAYLTSVTAFVTSGHDIQQFNNWHQGVEFLIEGRSKRKFEEFLIFSEYLFSENILYKVTGTTWKTSTEEFHLYWEGGQDGYPVVDVPSLDLQCFAKQDSAIIFDTKGKYYPMEKKWVGYGGVVNWHRAGFEENQVVAKIKNYTVQMNRSQYKADSAEFKNVYYFGDAELMGDLEDKVLANVDEDRSHYPRFESYNNNLVIRNIFPNVDYQGGFIQRGSSFIGSGTADYPAKLYIKRNGRVFLEVSAQTFVIRASKLSATQAEVYMYLGEDTIYHPGVSFKFDNETRIMTLFREQVGRSKAPFYNTYHKLDMHVEILEWNIDGNMIHLAPLHGNTNRSSVFESADYFTAYRFDELYGLSKNHPLVLLSRCAKQYDSRNLTIREVAKCWQLSETEVRRELMVLSNVGFVKFDYNHDEVHIEEKTFNYVQAKVKKIDYDILQLVSNPKTVNNADLNLDSMYMQIHGVGGFNMSDSHRVLIFPTNGEVLMKKNRSFDFSGVVVAGRLEFFGRDFSFEYDSFLIRMPAIDSMRINVETQDVDQFGRSQMKRVRTVIEHINGKLEIDKFNNKSGKRAIKRWPVFTSNQESYAYYDKKEVQGGVYKRDDFYFKLEPFVFDSIDNFQNSSIGFKGTFSSGGIFEDFEETLVLNEENLSLGFVHKTPDEGMPVYGGKGNFTNDIHLSHDGLIGGGYVDYITSTAESQQFLFLPKKTTAIAQNFVIEEQFPGPPEYPAVNGKGVIWEWHPYEDTLMVSSPKHIEPFSMYDGGSRFTGTLYYDPDSLVGGPYDGEKGRFEFDKAITQSNNIRFKFYEFFSDTADFALKTGSLGELGFDTKNMRAHVSFKDRIGHFWANGDASEIDFPKNEYKAKMDQFTWHMDDDLIDLTAKKQAVDGGAGGSIDIEGAKLTCTHKYSKSEQDSLFFYSSKCQFDLRNEVITADEVKYIDVADAEIVPDSGRVVIYEKAKMKPFQEAVIIANKTNRFHRIYDAQIEIANKIEYKGRGKYDYKDINGMIQIVDFKEISVSTQTQTIANGPIGRDQDFTLSPKFRFNGAVSLIASKELLEFAGNTQIMHDCQGLERPWIGFTAPIDPKDVQIPIDSTTRSENGKDLFVGLFMGSLPSKVYSLYGGETMKPADDVVAKVNGVMTYNYSLKEYRTGSEKKVSIPNLLGDYMVLDEANCVVKYEGNHGFGADLGRVELKPVSNITHDLKTDSVLLETSMKVDFFFEEKGLKIMAKDFQDNKELESMNFDNRIYSYALKSLVGEKEGEKLKSEITLQGKMKRVPDELASNFYLAHFKMFWNPQKMAFQSIGDISLANSMKEQINKQVTGHIEIKKRRNGDMFSVYIRPTEQSFYFFTYSSETMETVSTNDKYNEAIKDAKKNKQERSKDQARFKFIPTQKTKAGLFLRQL
ncbi:MAG: hypothetical protein KDC83_06925 [Flavobacteriales bacterium]|nr:hypothetical protein [Flavobacteriales bacterium]